MTPSSEGVLRVLRDVTLQRLEQNEFVAIGREAATIGDVLTIEAEPESVRGVSVRVIDSRPIVIDGTVRHRLRLEPIAATPSNGTTFDNQC